VTGSGDDLRFEITALSCLPGASAEGLAALRPAFDPVNGTVTAGTSSALSDGAAGSQPTTAILLMRARGVSPSSRARDSLITNIAAAPRLIRSMAR
jgi:acetyl-CoA acyltransferase